VSVHVCVHPDPGAFQMFIKIKQTHISTITHTHTHTQTHTRPLSLSLSPSNTHTHGNIERQRRVRLSSALVPGFPDQLCVAGWSMRGLSGVERANGQVSGSDTSWLPLPITTTSVNRPHRTPLLLTHTHTHTHTHIHRRLDSRRKARREHSQACSIHRPTPDSQSYPVFLSHISFPLSFSFLVCFCGLWPVFYSKASELHHMLKHMHVCK